MFKLFLAIVAFWAIVILAMTGRLSAATLDPAMVKPGIRCPHCVFAGTDLSGQCVKGGDLNGADFSGSKLVLACMSKTNFRQASFRRADLSGANLSYSKLDGADFAAAIFSATQARGTDFSHARNLTQTQLDGVCGDAGTRAPAGLSIKRCE